MQRIVYNSVYRFNYSRLDARCCFRCAHFADNSAARGFGGQFIVVSLEIFAVDSGGVIYESTRLFNQRAMFASLAILFILSGFAFAQSTGSITGTVTDPSGAVIPNAAVTIKNEGTGVERATTTDSAGIYLVPLPVGKYRIEVKATGMQPTAATDLDLQVATTARQDFSLKVSTASTVIEITAAPPLIDSTTASVGGVVDQKTVQEIPLNGRHFVDLALLVPGTVVPPANGFLTAALRGQGSFSFNSAGARETSVNFMVNGINLNDPNQNQITFQPPISTIEDFKIDNQTFSAEYGRNSGSIMNMATRSGTNQWHGDLYEFLRNNLIWMLATSSYNPRWAPWLGDGTVPSQPVRRQWRRVLSRRTKCSCTSATKNCASVKLFRWELGC